MNSNLVDPASNHTLVSKIKPCMSKYKRYTVKLRTAHYISYSFFDSVFFYMDTCGKSRNNTCLKAQLFGRAAFIWFKPIRFGVIMVNQNNLANRRALLRRWIIQVSAPSVVDGSVLDYHDCYGWRRIRVRFRRGSLRDGYHIQGRQQARKLLNVDSTK